MSSTSKPSHLGCFCSHLRATLGVFILTYRGHHGSWVRLSATSRDQVTDPSEVFWQTVAYTVTSASGRRCPFIGASLPVRVIPSRRDYVYRLSVRILIRLTRLPLSVRPLLSTIIVRVTTILATVGLPTSTYEETAKVSLGHLLPPTSIARLALLSLVSRCTRSCLRSSPIPSRHTTTLVSRPGTS